MFYNSCACSLELRVVGEQLGDLLAEVDHFLFCSRHRPHVGFL